MSMIVNWVKGIVLDVANKPLERKSRILRYIACGIIFFIGICKYYWNLLAYIDLPCAPLIMENYRRIIHSASKWVFIVCIAQWALSEVVYKINKKYWCKVQYVEKMLYLSCSLYFFMYALNLLIEYSNGICIVIKKQIIVAVVYVGYCTVTKLWIIHKKEYEENRGVKYTGYCDNQGKEIPEGAFVFYKGKKYEVIKRDGKYILGLYDSEIRGADSIKLEDAACDMQGQLFLNDKC